MELTRNVLIIFFLAVAALAILQVADIIVAWYENRGLPLVGGNAAEIADSIGYANYSASEYDVWGRVKPYITPLDVALAVATLAALAGIFIYTRERT